MKEHFLFHFHLKAMNLSQLSLKWNLKKDNGENEGSLVKNKKNNEIVKLLMYIHAT